MNRFEVFFKKNRRTEKEGGVGRRRLANVLYCLLLLSVLACWNAFPAPVMAQGPSVTPTPGGSDAPLEAPENVDIEPEARDEEIRERLDRILRATGWFENPEVEVQEGVAFLRGQARTEDHKNWAGDLARNTQDVVAVVNQIELIEPSIWDFQPAITSLRELWFSLVRSIPIIGFSLLVLLITWIVTRLSIAAARGSFLKRLSSPLLSNVGAYTVGTVVFLIGLYVVLRVAGLTTVAMTVIGGTGLLGLVLGIAFRDITENFLASIFLSLQTPFRTGDLVEMVEIIGFVQALTTRVTVIMTLDGNLVQIPNATVYKSNIVNYTSNPNRRVDFGIGIGYQDIISEAQTAALKVLENHPAILKDPEPWVLVDSLGSATVNLRVYFWLDSSQHSLLKVKSSVIRLVKRAFQTAGISMPDESREIIFPEGVPLRQIETDAVEQPDELRPAEGLPQQAVESTSVDTDAEAGLRSEAGEIKAQANRSWKPDEGENLLDREKQD
jgi:small-conductance mechanosensitive channel